MTLTTCVEHALQFDAQCFEPGNATLDFRQVVPGEPVYSGAGLIRLRTERQQFADGGNFKAKVARVTDKIESRDLGFTIPALATFGARRRRQEFHLLVIADGRNLDACPAR